MSDRDGVRNLAVSVFDPREFKVEGNSGMGCTITFTQDRSGCCGRLPEFLDFCRPIVMNISAWRLTVVFPFYGGARC